MKYMLAALLALGVLCTGVVQAKVEDTKKTHIIKKKSVYKKTAKPKAKPAQVQTKSHRKKAQPKKSVYKNVTKRAESPAKAKEVAAPKVTEPITTPKTTEETAYQKLTNWLGVGAGAGASAAAKQALIGHHRVAGYRIGPRDWHHNFPKWWANRGWTAADVDGVWYFAGYPIEWWATHYPTYFKDAIREEYAKTHTEKK